MHDPGFTPCINDLEIWVNPDVQSGKNSVSTGGGRPAGDKEVREQLEQDQVNKYYEYVIIHYDDLMGTSCRLRAIMHSISDLYKLNEYKDNKLPYSKPYI